MKLSALDETLKSLGKRVSQNDPNSNGLQNKFWLVLPESSTKIKEGLEIRHLRKLCEEQIRSITTSNDLCNLAQNDSNVENISQWLTTWCIKKIINNYKIFRRNMINIKFAKPNMTN